MGCATGSAVVSSRGCRPFRATCSSGRRCRVHGSSAQRAVFPYAAQPHAEATAVEFRRGLCMSGVNAYQGGSDGIVVAGSHSCMTMEWVAQSRIAGHDELQVHACVGWAQARDLRGNSGLPCLTVVAFLLRTGCRRHGRPQGAARCSSRYQTGIGLRTSLGF